MHHTLKDFYPLIGVSAVILLATVASVYFFSMLFMPAFMGWFFVVFGGLKVWHLKDFAIVYREYDIIAMRSWGYAYLYPFIELTFGLCYLSMIALSTVNIAVVVVMVISALGVYIKLRKHEEIMCACLGTVFKVPMTWVTLGEDLLMAVMAGYMLMM